MKLVLILMTLMLATFASAKEQHPPALITLEEVTNKNATLVFEQLKKHFEHGDRHFYLRIDSLGGDLDVGNGLIVGINELKKQGAHLTCLVDQKAESMAFVILQAVCDVRIGTKNAVFMAHNGHFAPSADGGIQDVKSENINWLAVLNESMALTCANRLDLSLTEYKSRIADKDWIIVGKEALRENIIDLMLADKI